jgi:NAD(P)H-dependent FMN reductase
MHTAPTHPRKVLVMAASTRTGSINQALARRIADRLDIGAPVEIVDLRKFPLPLYDGDLEARDGVPAAAAALAGEMAAADVLVLVSPEYNGTFTPLLKNTVDWVTRIDASALAHLRVLLASASPGRGGGANGVAMVRTWLSNMGIDTAERTLSVGEVSVGPDGELVDIDHAELARFVSQATAERVAA